MYGQEECGTSKGPIPAPERGNVSQRPGRSHGCASPRARLRSTSDARDDVAGWSRCLVLPLVCACGSSPDPPGPGARSR